MSKHQTPKPKLQPEGISLGNYRLLRTLKPRGIWILHVGGEAMLTEETKLAGVIARFWKRNF